MTLSLVFAFNTTADATRTTTSHEKVRFTADGKVGIGTDAPKVGCHIGSGSATDPIASAECLIMGDNQAFGGTAGNLCIQSTDVQAINKGGMLTFAGERADNQSGAGCQTRSLRVDRPPPQYSQTQLDRDRFPRVAQSPQSWS